MAIIRVRKNRDFTVIPNSVFRDVKCPKSLGVLCYLLSMPDAWQAKPDHLQNHFGVGRDYIRGVFKTLRSLGYATLKTERGEGGKVLGRYYDITETPTDGKSGFRPATEERENRTTGKPSDGKPGDIVSTIQEASTKEEVSTERENAREKNFESAAGPDPETTSADDVQTLNEFEINPEWEAEMDALGDGAHPIETAALTIDDFMRMWEMTKPSWRINNRWAQVSEAERAQIAKHLPEYLEKTPDPRYRTTPENYLANKKFTEAVIDRRPNQNKSKGNGRKKITFEERAEHAARSANYLAEYARRKKEAQRGETSGMEPAHARAEAG